MTMKRSVVLFIATFIVGAVAALVARAVMHEPYAEQTVAHMAPPVAPVVPAAAPAVAAADMTPINSICAICGMDVDPAVPTAMYQGKVVGFGCRACPPKFAADPDAYGPAALRNEIAE
jgi:hypothetical protein